MTVNIIKQKMVPTLEEKVNFLSAPSTYPNVETVDIRETRLAWVFLAGDRVFKFKKPIQQSHLDYTTLAERHRICGEEVRLNRRFSPEIYLDLAKLTQEPDGTLAIDGRGRVIEWLVKMKRLPDALFLDNAIKAGTVDQRTITAVAKRLVQFFANAPAVRVDPRQYVSAYLFELNQNRNVFLEWNFNSVSARGIQIVAQLEALLKDTPELFTQRVSDGYIVEGHGDLRPEHIHLSDPPLIIDCLEFRRDLRLLDPFEEVSYLSMECAVLGAPWIGPVLMDYFAAHMGRPPTDRQLAFYTAFRATLRARQALAHLLVPVPRTPERWLPLAKAYLDEAAEAVVTLFPQADPPANHFHEGRE